MLFLTFQVNEFLKGTNVWVAAVSSLPDALFSPPASVIRYALCNISFLYVCGWHSLCFLENGICWASAVFYHLDDHELHVCPLLLPLAFWWFTGSAKSCSCCVLPSFGWLQCAHQAILVAGDSVDNIIFAVEVLEAEGRVNGVQERSQEASSRNLDP